MAEPSEGGSYNTFLDSLNRFSEGGTSSAEPAEVDVARALYEVAEGLDRARFNLRNGERILRVLSLYVTRLEEKLEGDPRDDLNDLGKAVEDLASIMEDQSYVLERSWDSLRELVPPAGPSEEEEGSFARLRYLFLRSERPPRSAATRKIRPATPKS